MTYPDGVTKIRLHVLHLATLLLALLAAALPVGSGLALAATPGPIDALRQAILSYAGLRPGMVVAEIGMGRGWFLFRAAEQVGPTGTVYGTDIDPAALASVRRQLEHVNPGAGRIEVRLCQEGRDTALDDLPPNHLDVILMIDSLCFDARVPRERNVAYLGRFLRLLRPGGLLVHHMDCQCDVAPQSVVALFEDAGFSSGGQPVEIPPEATSSAPDWRCKDDAARQRHEFVGVFHKPAEGSLLGESRGAEGH